MRPQETEMRTLLRLIVLALAAVGAKTLYDWLAPRREELQHTGTDFVARTASAAREVTDQATEAARRVTSAARDTAGELAETAAEQAQAVKAAAEDARDEAVDTLGSGGAVSEPDEDAPSTSTSTPGSKRPADARS